MSHKVSLSRQAVIAFVAFTTILWSVGLAFLPFQAKAASAGDLIKASGSALYYYAGNGKRYVFPTEAVYKTWYADFNNVKTITDAELSAITIGGNVVMRPGTYLVKIMTDAKVYAVEPSGVLRWVETEAVAKSLWGTGWASMVRDVADTLFTNYTTGATSISTATYPAGSLVSSGGITYYIAKDGKKQSVDAAGMSANGFQSKFVSATTLDLSGYVAGTAITALDATLSDTSQGGGGSITPPIVGAAVTVSLASTTPAATTLVSATTDSQAQADFVHLNFTAPSDSDVIVSELKVTGNGIFASSDISTSYIFIDGVKTAESISISDKILTFKASGGLFTVAKGSTKTVSIRADLANGVSASRTIAFGIAKSTDVVTTGGANAAGTFPTYGNTMSTTTVTDLGRLQIGSGANAGATAPGSIDPGQKDAEVMRFNVLATNQNIALHKIMFTVVGSIATSDVANIKLFEGSTQLGVTVAALATDKTVTFDMSAAPYQIKSGNTKTISVKADIIGGTSRNFQFSLQRQGDITALDQQYAIYIRPVTSTANNNFSVFQPTATTINAGTVVATADSEPNGRVANDATNVTLASFSLKASGEDVKVTGLTLTPTLTDTDSSTSNGGDGDIVAATNINDVKLYVEGTQVGTTQDIGNGSAYAPTFSNSFIVKAGATTKFTIVADVSAVSTAAEDIVAGDGIVFAITAMTGQGVTSLSTVTFSTLTSNVLTVASGALSVATSTALSSAVAAAPSGVALQQNVLIGKYVITAGAGEGVKVNQIVLKDNGTNAWGVNFSSVFMVKGGADPAVSTNYLGQNRTGSTTVNTTYSYDISPEIEIAKGAQMTIDVYASAILSGATTSSAFAGTKWDSVSYRQLESGTSTTDATDVTGQSVYLATSGTLTAAIDANTPIAAHLIMGNKDITVAKFKLSANLAESLTVSRVILYDTMNVAASSGSLVNLRLYDGSTLLGTIDSLATTLGGQTLASATGAVADFQGLTKLVVSRGDSKVITVKADVHVFPVALSGSTHLFSLQDNVVSTGTVRSLEYRGANGTLTQTPTSDVNGTTMTTYRTGLTVGLAATPQASGLQARSVSNRVAVYNFSADPAFDIGLYTITFNVSGNALPTSGTSTYTLKDNDGNTIATKSVTNVSTQSVTGQAFDFSATPETIARGTTEIYHIYVDSTASGSDTSFIPGTTVYFTFQMQLTTWNWHDGARDVDGGGTINTSGASTDMLTPLSTQTDTETLSNVLQY